MARIISIVNQKGGVGKTTTAVNLSRALVDEGQNVLLVDMDPQANATSGLGVRHRELPHGIYDSLARDKALRDIVHETSTYGFHLAPATIDLAGANIELVNVPRREYRLHDALHQAQRDYDYVLIDCPPSLGLLTLNSIVASNEVLIPVQSEYYALEGLSQLLETIDLIRTNLKPETGILGAVLTMYNPDVRLSQEVLTELYRFFPNTIFRSVIPRHVHYAEAPSHGKPVAEYKPGSVAAKAYAKLARELLATEHPRHPIRHAPHHARLHR